MPWDVGTATKAPLPRSSTAGKPAVSQPVSISRVTEHSQ